MELIEAIKLALQEAERENRLAVARNPGRL